MLSIDRCLRQPSPRERRLFGLVMGTVLLVMGLVLRHHAQTAWPVVTAIGALLLTLGMIAPRALHWPAALWGSLGMAVYHVALFFFFAVAYFTVFCGIGLLLRLARRDPLRLRKPSTEVDDTGDPGGSLWIDLREKEFTAEDMERPF